MWLNRTGRDGPSIVLYEYLVFLFEKLPNIDINDPAAIDSVMTWSDILPARCKMPVKDDDTLVRG